MKLLVITPTLGLSPFLGEAVASVVAAAADIHHVIVCPGTEVERLAREFPGIEVIGDDARGVYAAINRGLRVDGAWDGWTWLNDDDRWCAEGMARVVRTFQEDSRIDVVYGRVGYIESSGAFLGFLPIERCPSRLGALMGAGVSPLSQQGTIVRRSHMERCGPLELRYRLAADFDFWACAVVAGARFEFVDARVADFRICRGQLSHNTQAMAEEMHAVVQQRFGGQSGWRSRLAAARFRAERMPEIVARFFRTGCWRTSSLLRRYGGPA